MKDNIKYIIQHVISTLSFLVGAIFFILKLCGVVITINEADINSLLFGLGSFISICIEFAPFIIKLLKDNKITKIYQIVKSVVDAVEELEGLDGAQKKEKAVVIISKECEKEGLNVSVEDIENMIDAAVALRNKVVK